MTSECEIDYFLFHGLVLIHCDSSSASLEYASGTLSNAARSGLHESAQAVTHADHPGSLQFSGQAFARIEHACTALFAEFISARIADFCTSYCYIEPAMSLE